LRLYLIRHGETDWNKVRKMQGSSDIDLNEYGRQLARDTREGLLQIPFEAAYTSPLRRAEETAEIILSGRNIPLYKDPMVQEISFGSYEGRLEKELQEAGDDFLNYFSAPEHFRNREGVESHEHVIRRASGFLKEVILPAEGKYENIAVFSHGGWIHAMLTYIYEREVKDFWHPPRQLNCGVSAIDIENGRCRVISESKIYYSASVQR
jgi:broad specificity phosphatase PhoE